jgi:glycosyltransferase involved in cell wall biosynthesis
MNDTPSLTLPPLPRLHLFEFIDQDWWPASLRNLATDYLHTVSTRLGIFDAAAGVLARGLGASAGGELLDLGSGGRGPLPRLRRLLAEQHGVEADVVLTDKYPNAEAAERARAEGVTYLDRSVDALRVPADLRGMRTLFSALHHFRPEEARAVLADAQARGVPIAAFETVRRTPGGLLSMLLVPLFVLLFTPLVRPVTPLRLLLTYGVPVAPFIIFWDGVVSALRAHRPEELRALTASLAREGYTWEVGEARVPGKPPISYVLGMPTR